MLSIRAKLTLWYLGITALVLASFAVAIYFDLSRRVLTVIDTSLYHQAERIARVVGFPLSEGEVEQPGAFMLAPQFVSIVNQRGEVTDRVVDREGHDAPVNPVLLERAARDGQPQFEDVAITPDEQARVITWPARDEDGETFYVVVGQSLGELHMAQRRLLLLLGVSIPAALALASLGGLWLAHRAISPVDRIRRAAERIGRGSLSERVSAPARRDEIGRLAATFNAMLDKLEKAFERERRFTADASHELRTPLAVLRGDIEVTLRRERPAAEYREVLESSLEEIVRLSELADNLLTLARSDAGEAAVEFEPVSLDRLAREACDYLRPLAESVGVTLDYAGPTDAAVIEGDRQRLKQLLLNLLDNAIKYTPRGGRVGLTLTPGESEVAVVVADTGRGIPAEALPHIFERFYRQTDPRDLRVTGFGLGLAISKWIVEAHGGAIEAESAPGQGARFRVRLPLARAATP